MIVQFLFNEVMKKNIQLCKKDYHNLKVKFNNQEEILKIEEKSNVITQIKLFIDEKQDDCKNLSEKISDKTIYSVNSCKNIHECQEVFKSKEIYQQNIFNNQQKLSDLFDEKIKENEKLREDNNRFKI